MCPSSVVRKSITIPAEVYEGLFEFKDEEEVFSHFCTRIFEFFLAQSRVAKFGRVGISRRTFDRLIAYYPKEKVPDLVQSLKADLEIVFDKKVKYMDLEKELAPYLKKILVDIKNIFTMLSFNFLDRQNEFQMFITHGSTEQYADFWAEYVKSFFNDLGYKLVEREVKKGYLYFYLKKCKKPTS